MDKTTAKRVLNYMEDRVAASEHPRQFGRSLTGPLGDFWRYRVGRYRIICNIQDDVLRVLVVRIATRDRAYR